MEVVAGMRGKIEAEFSEDGGDLRHWKAFVPKSIWSPWNGRGVASSIRNKLRFLKIKKDQNIITFDHAGGVT
jgi:hypothetical protein